METINKELLNKLQIAVNLLSYFMADSEKASNEDYEALDELEGVVEKYQYDKV